MIKLFVSDIDGCLATPYTAFHLEGLGRLRRYANDAAPPTRDTTAPAISLCSGRSYPYVEAMAQALDLTVPVLFEGGGGRFDPVEAQTTWTPTLTDEIEAEIAEVRHWFTTECIPGTKLSLDHAKRTQAGIVSPDLDEIVEATEQTERFVAENVPDLRVYSTDISVDVVPPGITKANGLKWLVEHVGVEMSEVAYIGDAGADVEALSSVGISFAPANAEEEVLQTVDYVTKGHVLDGTLEAYRRCLEENRS